MEQVAITGMGIVSPLGCSVEEYWQALLENRVALTVLESPTDDWAPGVWSRVPEHFDPLEWMDPPMVRVTDRLTHWTVAAASQAVTQSGVQAFPPERTAVVLGCTMGSVPHLLQAQSAYDLGEAEGAPPRLMSQVIPNVPAAHVAMRWHLHGPLLTISTACASSLDAIGQAARMIERGEVDYAIAGGVESLLAPLVYQSLVRARAVTRTSDPARPFDRQRSGFVMGEGAGVVVLEREEFARGRGQTVLARVRGYGSVADAYHVTSPDPSGRWEARAMTLALEDAHTLPGAIDAVIAHGTGTVVGDAAEIAAINAVFGRRWDLFVTSVKGHMGHSMAASGVMGVIAGVMALHAKLLPPTAGTREADPLVAFSVVTETPRRFAGSAVAVNAFGFGGQNASLIIGH